MIKSIGVPARYSLVQNDLRAVCGTEWGDDDEKAWDYERVSGACKKCFGYDKAKGAILQYSKCIELSASQQFFL